ncbi:MAG: S-layer homology domain-containing protein [Oscillospiraceae bacterium]|nr:S-layer homology domain-containing protein [Oscillospiraceae bacterium]
MKRFASLLLAALLALAVLPASAAAPGFSNLTVTARYTEDTFADAAGDDIAVAAVYGLGLMRGNGQGSFNGSGVMRYAEVLALACRLHSLYRSGTAEFETGDGEDGPWYQVYLDYALSAGILEEAPEDLSAQAVRRDLAALLAKSLPESAYPAVNRVADNALADVFSDSPRASEIYLLCRAGVLVPEEGGALRPDAPVTHDYAAAVLSRAAYRSLRNRYTLSAGSASPLLAERPALADEALADCAVVGNTLAQGLNFYSGLGSVMHFYTDQYATVATASELLDRMDGRSFRRIYLEFGLNEFSMDLDHFQTLYGEIVDRLRQDQPGADIYVMSLTPVTADRNAAGNYTMERIRDFNSRLQELCRERECAYLDCCDALCDEDGWLPAEYAGWDGSPHLSEAAYRAWEKLIRTRYL